MTSSNIVKTPEQKAAAAARCRAYRKRHPERVAACAKASWEKHKAERVACASAWVKQNQEKRTAIKKRYYERNSEKLTALRREYYKLNKETILAAKRLYDDEHKQQHRSHLAIRRARIRGASIVPFTTDQLNARLSMFGNRCWMCSKFASQVDHVIPLAKGGPHVLANLRPACLTCNCSKGSRPWRIFLPERAHCTTPTTDLT